MFIKMKQLRDLKFFILITLTVVFSLTLTSCGSQERATESILSSASLDETDLFELRVPLQEVTSWGLNGAENDEFLIKSYSDPKRENLLKEKVEVIPDYCLPFASLVLDSKESDADLYSYQSFLTQGPFNYLEVSMRVFSSPEIARGKFDSVVSVKNKCGTLIPKNASGETESEWNLWETDPFSSPVTISWESELGVKQAWSISIKQEVIYTVGVILDTDLAKAISMRKRANEFIDMSLEKTQR
jgi:hypothetical protein